MPRVGRSVAEPALQYPDLVRQKGVLPVVAGADGAAQDDEQVGSGRLDPAEIVQAGLDVFDPVPVPGQRLRKRAQIFESHVPDDHGAPAGGGCGIGH